MNEKYFSVTEILSVNISLSILQIQLPRDEKIANIHAKKEIHETGQRSIIRDVINTMKANRDY